MNCGREFLLPIIECGSTLPQKISHISFALNILIALFPNFEFIAVLYQCKPSALKRGKRFLFGIVDVKYLRYANQIKSVTNAGFQTTQFHVASLKDVGEAVIFWESPVL